MVFKWRDELTDKFLDYYREEECLWNINRKSYKNKTARDIAYNKICARFNIPELTVADVKNKIKIIRTNYKVELNKIKKSEQGELDDVYVPRVFWFKKVDSFLRDVLSTKGSLPNLTLQADPCPQEDELITVFKEEDQSSMKEYNEYLEHPEIKQTPLHVVRTPTSRKRRSDMITVKNSINKLQRIVSTCIADEDEFDYFAKSIAVQLKRMPLERALVCQEKLQAVLKEERLYQLRHKSAFSMPAASSCSNLSCSSEESTGRDYIDRMDQSKNEVENSVNDSHFDDDESSEMIQ